MAVSKEWAFNRSFLRKIYNREVYEYFKDLSPDDFEDINIPRKAAFRACLIMAKESQMSALQKQFNFRYLVQRVQDRPEVYGIPVQEYQQNVKFKPQIQLFFRQDLDATPDDYRPIEGEISLRLIQESSTTITETELTNSALIF